MLRKFILSSFLLAVTGPFAFAQNTAHQAQNQALANMKAQAATQITQQIKEHDAVVTDLKTAMAQTPPANTVAQLQTREQQLHDKIATTAQLLLRLQAPDELSRVMNAQPHPTISCIATTIKNPKLYQRAVADGLVPNGAKEIAVASVTDVVFVNGNLVPKAKWTGYYNMVVDATK